MSVQLQVEWNFELSVYLVFSVSLEMLLYH